MCVWDESPVIRRARVLLSINVSNNGGELNSFHFFVYVIERWFCWVEPSTVFYGMNIESGVCACVCCMCAGEAFETGRILVIRVLMCGCVFTCWTKLRFILTNHSVTVLNFIIIIFTFFRGRRKTVERDVWLYMKLCFENTIWFFKSTNK